MTITYTQKIKCPRCLKDHSREVDAEKAAEVEQSNGDEKPDLVIEWDSERITVSDCKRIAVSGYCPTCIPIVGNLIGQIRTPIKRPRDAIAEPKKTTAKKAS